jgi:hypothetical protein
MNYLFNLQLKPAGPGEMADSAGPVDNSVWVRWSALLPASISGPHRTLATESDRTWAACGHRCRTSAMGLLVITVGD